MLRIQSPAKINLFLYVTGKRSNGYHDLFTVMTCVDLYDEIELLFRQPMSTVTCDHPDVPDNESNIVFKAVALFNKNFFSGNFLRLSSNLPVIKSDSSICFKNNSASNALVSDCSRVASSNQIGVKIHIKKKIPVGAGLGGGSSNAASVLKAMNCFYGSPFSTSELMEIGTQLGADVPFFILGGTALAEGVGDKLTPISHLQQHHILLFYPGFQASTVNVYKNLDLGLTKSIKSNNRLLLKTSGKNQRFDIIKGLMHNDLEVSACTLYPEIGSFKKELVDCLPEKVMMTGSGSTFFSLFSDYEKAQRCFNELSTKWQFTRRKVFLSSFVNSETLI